MAIKHLAVFALAFALLCFTPVVAAQPSNLTLWAEPAVFVQYLNATFYANYTKSGGACITGNGVCEVQIPGETGPWKDMLQSSKACYEFSFKLSNAGTTLWKVRCSKSGYDDKGPYQVRTQTNLLVNIYSVDGNYSNFAPDYIKLLSSSMADNSSGLLSVTQNSTLGGNISVGVYDILFNWLSIGLKIRVNGISATTSEDLTGYIQVSNITSSADVAALASVSKKYLTNIAGFENFNNYNVTIAAEHGLAWHKCATLPCNSTGWSRILNFTEFQENSINYVKFNFNESDPEIQGGICAEDWSCTDWSACSGNVQTRTCVDLNSCGTATNKPAESQSCGVTESTIVTGAGSISRCRSELQIDVADEITITAGEEAVEFAKIKNTGTCRISDITINLTMPSGWYAEHGAVKPLGAGEIAELPIKFVVPLSAYGIYALNLQATSESASAGAEAKISVNPAPKIYISGKQAGKSTSIAENLENPESQKTQPSPITGAATAEIPENKLLSGLTFLAIAIALLVWKILIPKIGKRFR